MTAWGRFRALPLAGRVVLAALGALLVWELAASLVAPLGGGQGRSTSSSYSTGAEGFAAYADLLAQSGHSVERAKSSLDGLDAGATLVVADAALSDDDADAVRAFVDRGGRAVLVGEATSKLARALLGPSVAWAPRAVEVSHPLLPVPEVSGVRFVVSARQGSWRTTGPAAPFLGDEGRTTAAAADVGSGRVVLLADASPLQNRLLAEADNAAFAVDLAGPSGRPVVFAERGHGAASGRGLAALPGSWKAALVAGGIATVLAMWAAGRRFGPPEDEDRALPPPRKAYVDALAVTLAKTGQPEASMAPLRDAALERLRKRAGLDPSATKDELRAAAEALGLTSEERAALFGAVTSDEDAMSLSRAAARLGGA